MKQPLEDSFFGEVKKKNMPTRADLSSPMGGASSLGSDSEIDRLVARVSNTDAQAKKLQEDLEKAIKKTDDQANETEKLQKDLKENKMFLMMGFVILAVMVAGILMDVWSGKKASFENISNQINQQNLELEKISNKIDIFYMNEQSQVQQIINSTSSPQLNNKSVIKGPAR